MTQDATVNALGYVVIEASDLDAWQRFGQDILGMAACRADEDHLYLRMDEREWRILVQRGPRDDLAVMGWEVADHARFEKLVLHLRDAGYAIAEADEAACAARRVKRLAALTDPDGNAHEIFVGARSLPQSPFRSPQSVHFKTAGIGLGHLAVTCSDLAAATHFYTALLGFRISDYIDTEVVEGVPIALTFLRCNGRHHTLALAEATLRKRLLHLMVEVESVDDVGRALERCEREQVALGFSLGRHTNDQMLSFYPRTPSGFDVEYGCGGLIVDDRSWEIRSYTSNSSWGHVFRPGRSKVAA